MADDNYLPQLLLDRPFYMDRFSQEKKSSHVADHTLNQRLPVRCRCFDTKASPRPENFMVNFSSSSLFRWDFYLQESRRGVLEPNADYYRRVILHTLL